MTPHEQQAVLAACILASLADGAKEGPERALIREIAADLPEAEGPMPGIYRKILMGQVGLDDIVPQLRSEESRALAFEMAVCVVEADGEVNEKEREFLRRLGTALGRGDAEAQDFLQTARHLGSALHHTESPHPASPPPLPAVIAAAEPSPADTQSALDKSILHYALLCGALELLPQQIATLAIVPLQSKMVHQIGKHFGAPGGIGQAKELLTAAGVGLSSQVLDAFARKLFGKAGKGAFGALGKMLGPSAGSAGLAFATTYALGKLAVAYHSGNRHLDKATLKTAFQEFLGDGRRLGDEYAPLMARQAQSLNLREVLRQTVPSKA